MYEICNEKEECHFHEQKDKHSLNESVTPKSKPFFQHEKSQISMFLPPKMIIISLQKLIDPSNELRNNIIKQQT